MITLAQIGVGAWGKNHLRNFSEIPDCIVKSCCDKDKKVLEAIKAEYKDRTRCTADPEDIFSDGTIDAIVIATLPDTHARLAITAMERGKHVFIEKPLAMNIREGMAIKTAAAKYKRVCMVGHILLYHPAIRALKKYIDDGLLGEIRYIYSTRVNLGQVRKEENALWSLTSHDISVVSYLLGSQPKSVLAAGASYLRKDIYDVVFVNLNFANDAIAHIHASWLDPHKIRQFTVVGSKKMAAFDDMAGPEKLKIYDKGVDKVLDKNSYEAFLTLRSGDIFVPKIEMEEPLRIECQEFLNCVKNNRAPLANVDNGIAVLKVLEAAQKSLDKNGVAVKL